MANRVPYWTMQIKRGMDFSATLTFRSDDTLFNFDTAELLIFPQGGNQIDWTEGNGKFTNTSTGVYTVQIESTETAEYTWTYGSFRLNVVLDGEPDPSYTTGKVFVYS